MSKDLNDYQITKNLIIFFLVVAIVTVGLAYLGIYIQDSDYRKNIEMETREALKEEKLPGPLLTNTEKSLLIFTLYFLIIFITLDTN